MTMDKNRRRFMRIPFGADVSIEIDDRSYNVQTLYNLSIGGCLVPLEIEAAKGTPCRVRIPLSETHSVDVKGEVVRAEDGIVAINFLAIDPDSLFHLQNIIRYNSPDTEAVEKEIEDHPGIR